MSTLPQRTFRSNFSLLKIFRQDIEICLAEYHTIKLHAPTLLLIRLELMISQLYKIAIVRRDSPTNTTDGDLWNPRGLNPQPPACKAGALAN